MSMEKGTPCWSAEFPYHAISPSGDRFDDHSLKELNMSLEKTAYNIRKESNNKKKTRIALKGNTLVLLVDGKEHKRQVATMHQS